MRHGTISRFSRAAVVSGLALACTAQPQATSSTASADAVPTTGWIDATATLDPATTPVYAGDAPLKFDFLKDMRKGDGFTLSAFSLGAHSGTHIDAPMHFVRDGAPIDQVPLEPLIGPARVIDIPDNVQAINAAELARHDWKGAQRVIFRTRSSLRALQVVPRELRSEEHTSELQSRFDLVCRLLLEKKNNNNINQYTHLNMFIIY